MRLFPLGPKMILTWSIIAGCLAIAVLGAGLSMQAYAASWNNRVLPGVYVGSLSVGGLSRTALEDTLVSDVTNRLQRGVEVSFGNKTEHLSLSYVSADVVRDLVRVNTDALEEKAWKAGKSRVGFRQAWHILAQQYLGEELVIRPSETSLALDTELVRTELQRLFPGNETSPVNARFVVDTTSSASTPTLNITPEQFGTMFDVTHLSNELQKQFWDTETPHLTLTVVSEAPHVTTALATSQASIAEQILGTITGVEFVANNGETKRVVLTSQELADTLRATPTGLHVDQDALLALLTSKGVRDEIETTAQNARFQINNGRVEEFQGSKPGREIDLAKTVSALESSFPHPTAPSFAIFVHETAPEIGTETVNNLGIKEVLGVGMSSFRGSPANRIKNIKNGAKQLNGRLIAPGDTFSLNAALAPFTLENGYFPELVIKGDKILPEIGGGLCQVGTTAFRATMHAGLDVVERRNHSLVVSYYNDPSNNNPGTDATIYDPILDYKFKNNTDHYVLFQAEVLEATQELRFTLWGTSDGRKGSYTPPVVERWIPAGPDRETVSETLAPGERKCQSAHPGAITSFFYKVTSPDGLVTEREFRSTYRPLPKICLVGPSTVAENPVPVSP